MSSERYDLNNNFFCSLKIRLRICAQLLTVVALISFAISANFRLDIADINLISWHQIDLAVSRFIFAVFRRFLADIEQ